MTWNRGRGAGSFAAMSGRLVLSPHPDDAVLSLWHVLSGPGEVTVVNVFAGVARAETVGWWDALSGAADPRTRATERAAEDREALALAGREPIALDFIDAQYRHRRQPLEPIVERVEELAKPGTLILGPAALGGHPDHSLTRDAALALGRRGHDVALYADVPHATRDGWPSWVTGSEADGRKADARWRSHLSASGLAVERLEPEVHRLDPEQEERKRAAVSCYRTQLGALEAKFGLLTRPELLRYEVVWRLARNPAPTRRD
jgi:LmbE family N-acetylglucosaminyl deacetylase